jgi:hypothetical protein
VLSRLPNGHELVVGNAQSRPLARYQRLVDPDHSKGRPHVDPAVFVQPVPRCLEQILALSDLHNADAQTLT